MNNFQAIKSFWGSFGLNAYDEQAYFTRSKHPAFPHITYEASSGTFASSKTSSAHLWGRSKSWTELQATAETIKNAIGSGRLIAVDDGVVWFKIPEATPFAQVIASGSNDDLIKRILLTVEIEFLTV